MLNDKMVMTLLVTVARRVLSRSLHTIPELHSLFTCHMLQWMARSLESNSEEVVR